MQLDLFENDKPLGNTDTDASKICIACNEEIPLSNFYVLASSKLKYKEDNTKYHSRCKPCYLKNEKDKKRLKKTAPPPSKSCDCCGTPIPTKPNMDHDHETLAFRGWLCYRCNSGIGSLGDNVEGVERALKYLKAHYEQHRTTS